MITRTGSKLVIMIGLSLALALMARAPAAAGASLVLVSNDGQHWTRSLNRPVFDPARRWVPGDADTASFWVRNAADDPGDVTLTATTPTNQLIKPGAMQLAVNIGAGDSWRRLPLGQPIDLDQQLAPGDRLQILVRAAFDFGSGNQSQDKLSRLIFRVTLSQSGIGSGGNGGGTLPNTGASFPLWLLPLGALTSATGAAILRRRNRAGGNRR